MFSEFIVQNALWVGIFIILLNLLIFSFLQGNVQGASWVSALHLPQLQRGTKSIIIDVNDESRYAAGHIPNAVNFPLSSIAADNKELNKHKDKTTIVVCQSGSLSSKAAKQLSQMGFKDLHILRGGLLNWTKENLPINTGK
jgi:rhodanese-related sulfurtransferase